MSDDTNENAANMIMLIIGVVVIVISAWVATTGFDSIFPGFKAKKRLDKIEKRLEVLEDEAEGRKR